MMSSGGGGGDDVNNDNDDGIHTHRARGDYARMISIVIKYR